MMNTDQAKQTLCDIGRRMYERGFVAANEGNLTYRVSENEILCTPSKQSKGFLTPECIATIDLDGNQLAGDKKRSSEALLHLEVYRRRADVKSVVHCHPPHATAFAIAREAIPVGVTPEAELFLGEVPIAAYATPGTAAMAESIAPFVARTNTILLANHGTLSYDVEPERAFWWTEILESYCQTLWLTRALGGPSYLTNEQMREVIAVKSEQWGLDDPRAAAEFAKRDLGEHPLFRETWSAASVDQRVFKRPT